MKRLLFSALALAAGCRAASVPAIRGVEQVITSLSNPRIRIAVDPSLAYLGCVESVVMGGRARSQDFLFAEPRGGTLARVFIAHFERVEPGQTLRFRYPRLRLEKLGRHEYLHQSWPERDFEILRYPAVQALLAARNLKAAAVWLVDRYVRAVDSDRTSEIILFYLEPAGALPAPVEDLRLTGSQRVLWEPIDRDLSRRAARAFRVIGD